MQLYSYVGTHLQRNARADKARISVLAWLILLLGMMVCFVQPTAAADLTFNRAYTGTVSGQTFTANGTLTADAGSVNFNDGATGRNFTNTSGTLKYTVSGVPTTMVGTLVSRHPGGGSVAEAVVFTATTSGQSYLLVLTGTYSATYSASGSANQILSLLNAYLTASTADPGTSTIQVNGGTTASVQTAANASVTVVAKLADGTTIANATVLLAGTPSANGSITPASATTGANGTAVFTVTNTAAATVTYQATVQFGGANTILTNTVTVV